MKLSLLAYCLAGLASTVWAQSTFTPARPPAIPLAVKSPYLSAWLSAGQNGGNGGYLAGKWPVHWSNKNVGWAGMIRVDGVTYQWMGAPGYPNVNQTDFIYTSTKSIFKMNIENKVSMTITFLSPVTPTDLMRQSLVFSYMNVEVRSQDGKQHNVQLYSDISAEWASGDPGAVVAWNQGTIGNVNYHKVFRRQQIEFDESDKPDGNGMAAWGSIFYATTNENGLTYQAAADTVARPAFAKQGALQNTADSQFRQVQDRWPVFAYAKDLGRVNQTPKSTLFSIGLTQDNAVQFLGANGIKRLPSLWKSYFKDDVTALNFFHNDFTTMNLISSGLDQKIKSDSIAAAGEKYHTITSLTVRQSFGATQLVGTKDSTYMFMKEISSNGNTQTVDVVFPLHPIILYTNPTLLKYLLDPLFENQESGHYPNKYSIHDLGAHYPNATGHPDGRDEEMPVEECGNMLIMTLAYAQRSNDVGYLRLHYEKLKQWTSFLIDDSLIPANQLSTDDFAGRLQNQTNLALKGIIGIKAMSVIASLTGQQADARRFSTIAQDYIGKWQDYGIARNENPPHATLQYGANQTHGLLYNLWCDLELNLNLVPKSVYQMQSNFYPTIRKPYGVPLDTRHEWTKGDWELFAAATTSGATRDMFVEDLAKWINETPSNRPMTDLYETRTGNHPDGITFAARPVMGGAFTLLLTHPNLSLD